MDRPNILFAFADDWGRYASCYAPLEGDHSLNAIIDTPHIDRIAREGALFRNALVPAPSCTPCRSSVLSGRYFWQTRLGAILNGAVWDRDIPSYPLMLEAAGYHIGFTYKVWAPGYPMDDPYGGPGRRYQQGGESFGSFSQQAARRMDEGADTEAAKQPLYDEVRENFRAFRAGDDSGKPWCYWWGPKNTHRGWEPGSGKRLWGIDPDQLKGRLPAFLPDVHAVREDMADYLGECLAVDRGLGVLIEEIEASGELDNTLIVVSGDHGIPGFPRAKCNLYDIGCEVALCARLPGRIPGCRVIDDMVNLMDLAPTFLEAAGETPDPDMSARSLWPLLTSTASGQVEAQRDHVVLGRERHVAAARDLNKPYPQRAIRTHDHLYIRNYAPERWPMGDPKGLDDLDAPAPAFEELATNSHIGYADMDCSPTKAWMVHHRADDAVQEIFDIGFGKRPAEELYDLAGDPDHMHNLATDPLHEETRAQLAERLQQVLLANDDPRAIDPADCRFEHSPYTDPRQPRLTDPTPQETHIQYERLSRS